MAQQIINTGAVADDGTGDPLRSAFTKANANFTDLYTNKADLASPALTGNPTAPTQGAGNNTTRLATTAFVQAAITALINASPAALDTLNELAAALGNDANFAATMTAALAGKQPLDADLTAFAGLASAANKIGYFTAAATMALLDFKVAAADTSHVPILTPTTGAITSYTSSCSYLQIGKLTAFSLLGGVTNAGTGGGALNISLPFNALAGGCWIGEEYLVTGNIVKGLLSGGSNLLRVTELAAGASVIATGKGVRIGGVYIAA